MLILLYLFIGIIVASVLAIVLMLGLVFLCESTADLTRFGQMFCGFFILLIGIRGLWWARFAIPRHAVWQPRYQWQFAPWMDPWQAVVAFGLTSLIGAVILASAVRKIIQRR